MGSLLRRVLPPGARIRVLVVDDSLVVRRLVANALADDPQIEVVGSAPNGETALRRTAELRPDVITLDFEMPVMDGLETLRRLKSVAERPIVIMISAMTERGAAITIEALSLGADDYVTKPASMGSIDASVASLRSEVMPKIKQFFAFSSVGAPSNGAVKTVAPVPLLTRPCYPRPFSPTRKILAIGVSTGGPNALAAIMPMFPPDFALPILIVQHMPAMFTKLLAERLNTLTPLHVEEAFDGAPVKPGSVLVAPGGFHMQVHKLPGGHVSIALTQNPPEHSCRPSVDVLFRSVADTYGGGTIAAVLTGMGSDGCSGAKMLHDQGAYVIAQDEASCIVWGMPAAVVRAGAADAVVDLLSVVPEIVRNL